MKHLPLQSMLVSDRMETLHLVKPSHPALVRAFIKTCANLPMRASHLLLVVVLATQLSACEDSGSATGDEVNPGNGVFDADEGMHTVYGEVRARNESPEVDQPYVEAVIDGFNRLAIRMYHDHGTEDASENTVGSSYSAGMALGMLNRAGADSANEVIQRVLGVSDVPASALYPVLNSIDLTLASRANEKLEWRSANQVFVAEGKTYNELFLDTLTEHFDAPLVEADFENHGEQIKVAINEWAAEKTNQLIPKVLDDPLPKWTRFVLLNAVVLDALWEHEYAEVENYQFNNQDNTASRVNGFVNEGSYDIFVDDQLTAIELPYAGRELAMLVVQPAEFADYERQFDLSELNRVVDALQAKYVNARLPNWEIRSDINFAGLPMTQEIAGDGVSLDLSRLVQEDGLQPPLMLGISPFFQKAVIEVDKDGTRAAAVTVVGGQPTSDENPPVLTITIDRPFLYAVRDVDTGLILFAGRVLKL